MDIDIEGLKTWMAQNAVSFGAKLCAAALIFFLGRWIARMISNSLRKLMERRNVEPTLRAFVLSLVNTLLVVVVALAALNQLGIHTTSIVAILGAAGLAVGLAMQGSLANFAAGILIMIFRPFKVGDYIEAAGIAGVVKDITILTTVMNTPDNKRIIAPNSGIMGGNITNFSANGTRRLDLVFGVSYSSDLQKVQGVLEELIASDARCLKDPKPVVAVLALADSSVNFAVRPWVTAADYWAVFFDMQKNVKLRFDAEGISIPFPQRDVHLFPAGELTPAEEPKPAGEPQPG